MTTAIKSLNLMTTAELTTILADCDARIREQGRLIAETPRNTTAWAAMVTSRPGLLRYRNEIDGALAGRGA